MPLSTDEIEAYAQLMTALTAVLAVVVGPVIAFYLSKRQAVLSETSQRRHEWACDLRTELSEMLVEIRKLQTEMRLPIHGRKADNLIALVESGSRREARIKMLINPENALHMELVLAIEAAMIYASKKGSEATPEGLSNLEQAVFASARRALKEGRF